MTSSFDARQDAGSDLEHGAQPTAAGESTPAGDVDAAFRRFQRTGDAGALGIVFDGTAAELLRVASHLTSDLHAAEDLVQTTFLVAMQERHAWPQRVRVVAWLLAILANRARRHRREEARAPNPQRLPHHLEPGPEAAATAGELTHAVSDAIATMPEPLRPVLVLHLRHRLTAAEIALALGRPAGTVRTQIVRGLDRLRRALPAGLALGAASGAAPPVGLAAVRAVVLREAAALAAAVSTATPGLTLTGLLTMKNLLAGAAALTAAVVFAWLAWPAARTAGENSARYDDAPASVQPGPVAAEVEAVPAPAAAVESEGTRRALAPAPVADGRRAGVRGRCVDEEGHPLAGAAVELCAWPWAGSVMASKEGPPNRSRLVRAMPTEPSPSRSTAVTCSATSPS